MIIAGTGHRPKYCPCKYKDKHPWLDSLKHSLHSFLLNKKEDGMVVRAGGAIGWDTWLAQVAIECNIELHLYLPFPDQGSKWPTSSKKEYERLKELVVNFWRDE